MTDRPKTGGREMGVICFATWVVITLLYGSLWAFVPDSVDLVKAYATAYSTATLALLSMCAAMFGVDKVMKLK